MANALHKVDSTVETDSAEASTLGADTLTTDRAAIHNRVNEFREFIHLMPYEYQVENYDALIICSPKDIRRANEFANHLTNDIKFLHDNRPRAPKVRLMDDIRGNGCDSLNSLLQRSTFQLLFITLSFLKEDWSELLSTACLLEAKKSKVIPVLTEPSLQNNVSMATLLCGIKPINYFDIDQFYKDSLREMFSRAAAELVTRDVKLNAKRRLYYMENRDDLISAAYLINSSDYQRTQSSQPTERYAHESGLIEVDGPVCRRKRNLPAFETTAACNFPNIPNNTVSSNLSLASDENNLESLTSQRNPSGHHASLSPYVGHHVSEEYNFEAPSQSLSSFDSCSVEVPLSESRNLSTPSNSNTAHSLVSSPRTHGCSKNSVKESSGKASGCSSLSLNDTIRKLPGSVVNLHIHINEATNVNYGDRNRTYISTGNSGEDLEDDYSSSDEISRPPPLNKPCSTSSACNPSNTTSQASTSQVSTNPVHQASVSQKHEDHSQDCSYHITCDPNETFVKFCKS